MNDKVKTLLILLLLVAVISGAYALYGSLSGDVIPDTLSPATTTDADTAETAAPLTTVKTPAPDFTVYDADGNAVTLSSFRGKPVVLNFWASWCGPCESEMPAFEAAYKTYGDDVQFMMVNLTDGVRETAMTAYTFIRESGYTFPVYYDSEEDAAGAYSVYAVPVTYFLDADGIVVSQARGALTAGVLKKGIERIRQTTEWE